MARQPDLRKQQHWLDLIRRWQQSQLTIRSFCDQHSVCEANFYLWRRVLRDRGLLPEKAAASGLPPKTPSRAAFVKLTLDAASTVNTALEVILSGRRLLRVHPGFDPATLRQLVRVLEEPA